MDTLPSRDPQVGGFRSALARVRLSLSCPFRLLHTFHLLRPARHYPRVRIWRSSSERQRDFNPPEQRAAQRTLRPLLTSPPLAGKRSPQVRCSIRAAGLYPMRLDDLWASLFRASLPPAPGLPASSCSCGREFAFRFFQLRLAATPCGSATVAVIGPDWLLSSNKILPMLGTLRARPPGRALALSCQLGRATRHYGKPILRARSNTVHLSTLTYLA